MQLNLENTREFPLSDALREKLLTEAEECVKRSVAIKTRVRIHDDRATKDWFHPAMAAKHGGNP